MGARVIYNATAEKAGSKYPYRDLGVLLGEADIVSLHAALTPQTEKLINESTLAQMKTGAILVNTARGALIDELAVYAALLTGKLGAAGFDVFTVEPLDKNHLFLKLDNVVLAPHLGWLTEETLNRSVAVAMENSLCIKNSRPELLRNRVI